MRSHKAAKEPFVRTEVSKEKALEIFGANPYRSFWSNYERMEGLITHLHLFAYFLVAGSVLATERLWDTLWKTSMGASVIMAIYGFAQLGGLAAIHQGSTRLDGTLGNAAYLAVYMLFNVFLALFYMARQWKKNSYERWIYAAVAIIDFIILFYTATRGSLLGVLGGAFLAALLLAIFEKGHAKIRKTAIGIIVGLVVIVGIFFALRTTSFVKNNEVLGRFASISLTDKTTESRFLIWGMAWQGALERPILGWGQENFNLVFNKFYSPKMYDQEQWFDRTHNIVFDWLIDAGFLGVIGYFSLLGLIIYGIWKTKSFSVVGKSILTGMLAGYFVHNFFVFDNLVSYIIYFSIAAWIYSLNISEKRESDKPLMNMEVVNYGLAPVAAILLIVAIYFLNTRPIEANTTLISALQSESAPEQSLSYYKQAINLNTFGTGETRERLVLDAPGMVQNATSSVQNEVLSYAESQMEEQIKAAPLDARYELFLGTFLSQVGQYDQAIAHLDTALKESPEKQAIIIQKGAAYLSKQDYPDALAQFKEAYDLEPQYEDARIIYAIGAIYAGQKDLAKSLLAGVSEQTRATDDRVLSAYTQLGDYQDVLTIWQARVAASSTDPQAAASLAETYLKLGKRDGAIAAMENLKAAVPQYGSQIDGYISEIKAGKDPFQ